MANGITYNDPNNGGPRVQRFDPKLLPALATTIAREAPQAEKRNWFTAGLSAGVDQLQGLGGSAVSAAGALLGSSALQSWGNDVAARNEIEAQQNGRPDLETAPWRDGGAPVLPWLGYQAAKQVPNLAGMIAAGALVPEAAVPAALSRAGAFVPKWLGGGGLALGEDIAVNAASKAAVTAGQQFAKHAIGGAAFSYPQGVGSMYQEAQDAPGGADAGDAAKAALMGVPYAALEGLEPAQLSKFLASGLEGNIAKRVLKGMLSGSGEETVTEGIQTAMEQSFRPDLTVQEKMRNIVDGALTGGAVGGVFGGTAGVMRRARHIDPNQLSTDDLNLLSSSVDPDYTDLVGQAPQQQNNRPAAFSDLVGGVHPDDQLSSGGTAQGLPGQEDPLSVMQGGNIAQQTLGLPDYTQTVDAGEGNRPALPSPDMGPIEARRDAARRQMVSQQDTPTLQSWASQLVEMGQSNGMTPDAEAAATVVLQELRARSQREAQGDAGPLFADQEAQKATIRELTKGLQPTQITKQLFPGTEDDIRRQVHERLAELDAQDKDWGKNNTALARRLGIVDENDQLVELPQTEAATALTEEAPRAVADPNQDVLPLETGLPERYLRQPETKVTVDSTAPATGNPFADLLGPVVQQQAETATRQNTFQQAQAARVTAEEAQKDAEYSKMVLEKYSASAPGARGIDARTAPNREQVTADPALEAQVKAVPDLRQAEQAWMIRKPANVKSWTKLSDVAKQQWADAVAQSPEGQDFGALRREISYDNGPVIATDYDVTPFAGAQTITDIRDVLNRGANGEVQLTPAQKELATLVDEINAVFPGSNTQPETAAKAAKLVDMIRAGTSVADVRAAFEQAQTTPDVIERTTPSDYVGEAPLRGGQPRMVDINAAVEEAPQQPAREEMRTETADAVAKKEKDDATRQQKVQAAREAVAAAKEAGEISFGEEMRLRGMIGSRDFKGVADFLQVRSDELSDAGKRSPMLAPPRALPSAAVTEALKVARETGKARDVLKVLAKGDDITAQVAKVVLKVMPDIQLRVETDRTMRQLAAEDDIVINEGDYIIGLYDPRTDVIHMHQDARNATEILHEMVHALVDRHINKGTAVGRELQAIFRRFERYDDGAYGFTNAKEFAAEMLSNAEFRTAIQALTDAGKVGNLWQRFVNALRKMLGNPAPDFVNRVLELALIAGEQRIAAGGRRSLLTRGGVATLDNAARDIIGGVSAAADKIDLRSVKGTIREKMLGWGSFNHLLQRYGTMFDIRDQNSNMVKANGLRQLFEAEQERGTITARIGQLFTGTHDAYLRLSKQSPANAAKVTKLMAYTVHDVDPSRGWDVHSAWLKDTPENRKAVSDANKLYRELADAGHTSVYTGLINANETMRYAQMAMAIHNLVTRDALINANTTGFDVNPMERFLQDAGLHEDAGAAAAYWRGVVDKQVDNAQAYIQWERGNVKQAEAAGKNTEAQRMDNRLSPLAALIKTTVQNTVEMSHAPYFHLGRFGNHFVAFTMRRLNDTKALDPKAAEHIAQELQKAGFGDVVVSGDLAKPNVYIRLESEQERHNLEALVTRLHKQGWLDKTIEPKGGKRTNASDAAYGGVSMEALDKMIAGIEGDSSLTRADKERMISNMREIWLDMLPDTAVAKVMTERKNVQGFSADMMRAHAFRMQIASNALAALATSGKATDALGSMREATENAQVLDAGGHENAGVMRDIVDEMTRRTDERGKRPSNNAIDTLRAVNHAFFLGASPSYALVNMTQLGVLLWPELSKRHGYVASGKAIGKTTGTAFKIMAATMAEGRKAGRAADAIITEKALVQAGVDAKTAAFVMRMVNTGNIDIGSASRELGRVAEGKLDNKLDTALRYASAMGYYTETLTRLVAALSARELHGDKPGLDDYASTTVNEAMLNYSNWNAGRQTGKLGIAGQMTPVMLSFMQYQFQVIEKLYREVGRAFLGHATAEAQKKEARRFLAAHMTAMVSLAGTLGMPMASVLAMAAGKLKDLFDDDDEPYDPIAAWRGLLSDMFGKDVGEMLSRGVLSRGVGIDLAQRTGEQDLLPFSKLLTDRRKWEDASKDAAFNTLGAPISMLSNITLGARDIMNGEIMKGMQSMVPLAIRGPLQAYSMSENGYTDTAGNKLPMTVDGVDILKRALGFNPSEKAEYAEAKQAQWLRKQAATERASLIRRNVANAVEQGDSEQLSEWLAKAGQFDANQPAYAVSSGLAGALKQRAREQAQAAATGTPLGTNLKDLGAVGLTRYANY